MLNKSFWWIPGILLILESIWSLAGGKIYIKYKGWIDGSSDYSIYSFTMGCIFIAIAIFYKPKKIYKIKNPSFFAPKNTNKKTKIPKQEKPIKASKDKTNKAINFKNVKLNHKNKFNERN